MSVEFASNPAVQECGRECFPWLVPEPSQIVLQVVGRCQRLVQGQGFLQPLFFSKLRCNHTPHHGDVSLRPRRYNAA